MIAYWEIFQLVLAAILVSVLWPEGYSVICFHITNGLVLQVSKTGGARNKDGASSKTLFRHNHVKVNLNSSVQKFYCSAVQGFQFKEIVYVII